MIRLIFKKINFSKSYKDYHHSFRWSYMIFLRNMISLLILLYKSVT